MATNISPVPSSSTDNYFGNVVYTTVYSAIENPPSYLTVERVLSGQDYDPDANPEIMGVLGISYPNS
jgi:hypothetical protein